MKNPEENTSYHIRQIDFTADLPRTAKAITNPSKLSEYSMEKKKQATKTTVTNPPFKMVLYFLVFSSKKPTREKMTTRGTRVHVRHRKTCKCGAH